MKQPKEMSSPTIPSPRFRYWSLPPETIEVPVTAMAQAIPLANRLSPFEPGQTVSLPAAEIFATNIPQIRMARLAELLPLNVRSGEGKVVLPISRLAAIYGLVEQREMIEEERPQLAPEAFEASEIPREVPDALEPPVAIPPPPTAETLPKPVAAAVEPELPEPPAALVPQAIEAEPPVRPAKFPLKRTGLLTGLPMFRRKPPAPEPVEDLPAEEPLVLPVLAPRPTIPTMRSAPVVRLPEVFDVPVDLAPMEAAEAPSDPVVPMEAPEVLPEPLPPMEAPEPFVSAVPEISVAPEPEPQAVRILQTEHLADRAPTSELHDDEAMQALFLTEEKLSIRRVIELCGDLPGINSCVLAHGSMVVAAHNAPANVDLVSLSAHAEEMLKSMRESSARMGVGTVPAVTLHTEKGVISFFHRDDLTMLVFHKDRGFIPGVREKMAAVLGELTKARLALPTGEGRNEAGPYLSSGRKP